MDKENLNGIPEENTEEIKLCDCCGKKEAEEGSEYCADCEEKLLKKPLAFTGVAAGLLSLLFGMVVFAYLISGSAMTFFSGGEGDKHAENKVWNAAYESYYEDYRVAVERLNVINDFLNRTFNTQEKAYVSPGFGLKKKMINAVANIYGPLDAYYYSSGFLNEREITGSYMKDYARIYGDFQTTYMAVEETFNKTAEENADYKSILAEMDTYKGKDGINEVFLAYHKYVIAVNLGASAEEQLELVKNVEKAAEASGDDYSWLCNPTMAQALYEAGKTDESVVYLDRLIATNKSNYEAYNLKMKIQLMNGETEAAGETVAEFRSNHENCELGYYADILEIQYLRCIGEYDKALVLCTEADTSYQNVPETNGIMDLTYMMENKLIMPTEIFRQKALVLMIKGDYVKAFEAMFEAYQMESYYASYLQGVSSLNDPNFYGTLYLSAVLANKSGQMTEAAKPNVDVVLSMFTDGKISDKIEAVANGEKTVEEVLKEGDFELI